jgi:two-component system, cell cycle response regulator DivK
VDRDNHSVLIIDGSASHSFYMAMLLKRLEYIVRTSQTAIQALRMMAESQPTIIMTETALPDMHVIAMLREMKQNEQLRSIPVIVHTAEIDPGTRGACMAAGCVAYFEKPAELDALYKAIQSATESTPRQTRRIETSLNVLVGSVASVGEAARMEVVTSLSEGGLYIKTPLPEALNTQVPLTIFFPNREIKVKAEVHYSSLKTGGQHKQPGMGMQFVNISQDDRVFIRGFIKEQIAKGL